MGLVAYPNIDCHLSLSRVIIYLSIVGCHVTVGDMALVSCM